MIQYFGNGRGQLARDIFHWDPVFSPVQWAQREPVGDVKEQLSRHM